LSVRPAAFFFRNSRCLGCGAEVGYDPEQATLLTLPDDSQSPYRIAFGGGCAASERLYARCANYATPAGCNWLVTLSTIGGDPAPTLCRSCRLTRVVPDLSVALHAEWWSRLEDAKRQVVSTLITLKLPMQSRVYEDTERGLAFDLLRSAPDAPKVMTGHANGIVMVDIEEADDATRETRRTKMHEPYRSLVGHVRYEIGHYCWYRLITRPTWLSEFRELFGDVRADYGEPLRKHCVSTTSTGHRHGGPLRMFPATQAHIPGKTGQKLGRTPIERRSAQTAFCSPRRQHSPHRSSEIDEATCNSGMSVAHVTQLNFAGGGTQCQPFLKS
jgi:hypothetical protein